jgi:hypothetical protein
LAIFAFNTSIGRSTVVQANTSQPFATLKEIPVDKAARNLLTVG